ncbi:MAG: hypothetical protein ACD_43C00018G0002 [uncultured bacterium]|nr:MAG: hypothetical protein ACD_43C00018G0002 [uncultured bacterium]
MLTSNTVYSNDTLLSTAEAAKLFGVTRVTLFRRIQSGEVKAKKIGRNYVIRYGDLVGELSKDDKAQINIIVKKAANQYHKAFKLLSKE